MKETIALGRYFFYSKSILERLPKKDLDLIKENLRLKRVPKGRMLFEEGSNPRTVYILKRGRVKLFQRSADGGEQIVHIYGVGEMFGYRPLLSEEVHPASAMTLEECGIYSMHARAFLEVLNQSTALPRQLLKNLSHEFSVLVNRIAAFSQRSAKERIALALLIVNQIYRKSTNELPEITLSRSDLAAFSGTTGETLARILTRFKGERVIKTIGRRLIILKPGTLMNIIE